MDSVRIGGKGLGMTKEQALEKAQFIWGPAAMVFEPFEPGEGKIVFHSLYRVGWQSKACIWIEGWGPDWDSAFAKAAEEPE